MNPSLSEQDIKVFVDAVGHFFTTLATQPAEIRTAYLNDPATPAPSHDYTGVIEVTGQYRGSIAFSAPKVMLRRVLMCLNEPSLNDDDFLDATGEIANIFAGNARRHFGESLQISVPRLYIGRPTNGPHLRQRPYVIVIGWMGYKASLVVDVERTTH